MNRLGAIPLSADILTKANIGLWAFELDEGKPPRMYADTAMLGLIGLDHQVSPEETYHAWYDHIDEGSYGLVSDAVTKMTAGEHAEVQYPWHHPDGRTMIVRCGGVRNFDYQYGIRIEGTHQDVTQILHFDEKELERIRQQELELIKSKFRAETFSFVASENPDPERFTAYIGKRIIEISGCDQVVFRKADGQRLVFNTPGTETIPDSLCAECPFGRCYGNECCKKDEAIILKDSAEGYMGNPIHPKCPIKSAYMQKVFADEQLMGWININYLKEPHTFSDSHIDMMKTVADCLGQLLAKILHKQREEEIAARELADSVSRMDREIIEILASEYSSVYYIDLRTDALTPYTMNEETETTFGSVFRSGITYSEAYKLYVEKLIYPEDKAMMLRAGSVENIRHELANKKTFLTIYRNADNQFSEMKFVKVGDDDDEPVAVALGFSEKDAQIRQERMAEQERQMNFDIIEILASEYSSVYYIDLTTDGLTPYTMNEDTESTFGSVFRSGITYSEAYRLYVDGLVFPEDKPVMLKAGAIGNIMKELRTKKTFLTNYRDAEGHYCEMKFVKVGNEEGTPTAVALGFADKDSELRAKREEEQIRQRNIEIIEILASEYSSVYYIDMTTDELDPYTMNEQTESQFGSIFRSGIKYSQAFRMYVDEFVYPEDREMMLKAGSIYNILDELSNKKTFITQYRNTDDEYCEMKFVKVGDDENPQSVALGFSNKDDEIRAEKIRKEKLDRDAAVISGLSDDFGCVVYTSYDKYDEVHYRFDPFFDSHIDGWSEISNFRERLYKLTNTIMHPDDRKAFWDATRPEIVRTMVDRDGVYYVNFRTLIDGNETYYQAKFARDEMHPETNVIAGFHNVDAETKRELEALRQAKLANKAKTDFLFNMSHDIRTPMNAIIGFTNMALRHIDDKARVTDSLKKTQTAGELLLSLINDILDMSRIESGKITLNEKEEDLYQIFDSIESTMRELADAKEIALSFSFGELQNRYVLCDISRCLRVFVNLITNSIKYTHNGGWVKVRCEQIGTREDRKLYQITFEDNGIGMSEEFQLRAFDEFARENTATVSGIQGTGLGLSVCKSFVGAMGGTIQCRSKLGEGTTFTVVLPFRVQGKTSSEDHPGEVPSNEALALRVEDLVLTGKKVLLVEDNELNLEIAESILMEDGMIVETANDGTAAVEQLKEKGPDYYDFILMDIQMPVMNGYEATGKIREMYPDAELPIIALSANAFVEDKEASIRAGMNDHVAKPINIKELKSVLTRYIKRE